MTKHFEKNLKILSRMCIILAFSIVILVAGKVVFIPLAISILFAIVLNPFLKRLEGIGLKRILAICVVMLCFIIVLLGFFTFSTYQITGLIEDLPSIESKAMGMLENVTAKIENQLGVSVEAQQGYVQDIGKNAGSFLTGFVQTTSSVLTVVVQIPIYIFLILLYKDKFRMFIEAMYRGEKNSSETSIAEVKEVVQGYVFGMFLVICVLAVLNSIGLLLLGIDYAIFFGVFSAVLTVIPYIGNFIGGFFPFLVALVTKDSAWYAVGVIAVYAFVQFMEGNFITPNIMSSRVSINPLVALLALIIGGQILGVAGLILAIPAVGIVKVAFSHSETLKPLVILMEERGH